MQATYQTRLKLEKRLNQALNECAHYLSYVERCLFADICKGAKASDLKNSYLEKFDITARHFNAIRINLEGKIASLVTRQNSLINRIEERIKRLEKTIKSLERGKKKPFVLHQKKRALNANKQKLQKLIQDKESGTVRLCFGSKKKFKEQFHLEGKSFEQWKEEWDLSRNSEFYCLGSKDETAGNQTATLFLQDDGNFTMRLRLPNYLAKKYGKIIEIPNIHFEYGHEPIRTSLESCAKRKEDKTKGMAISYRLKRDCKGWRVLATTTLEAPKIQTSLAKGALGVDINADHLAVTETDRFGNPICSKRIPTCTYGKTKKQSKAFLSEASCALVRWAEQVQKPIVLEKLDFNKKKLALKESESCKYKRLLSGFCYALIKDLIGSRGFRFGVEVFYVNPAYTSLIGRIKFAKRYGLSLHQAAALVIARRQMGFSERVPKSLEKIPDGKGDHITFSLPVRNEQKHEWSFWRQINKKLKAALAAHYRAKNRSLNLSSP